MLTILNQPTNYLQSAGNNSTFTVSSSNVLVPNNIDYQYIANVYINGTLSATQIAFPDVTYNYGVFDKVSKLVSNFLGTNFTYTDTTASIFQTASNSSCQVQLLFGEQYTAGGSGFTQSLNLATSSLYTYLNSSLTYVNQNNNLSTYLVTSATSSTINFLSLFTGSSYTYNNLRNHLYYYISSSATTYLSVQTFDSNNNQLGIYQVQNPYSGSSVNGVYSVATGYPILSQLQSGSTALGGYYTVSTGNTTMFNSSVVSYNVQLVGTGSAPLTQVKNYIIGDNTGRWQNYIFNCYFLNELGEFESYQFNRKTQQSIKKSVSTYRKTPGTLQANGQVLYNTYDRQISNYFTELENSIELYSDWLTNAQCLSLFRSLFSSPVIYLEDINGVIQAANVQDKGYKIMNNTLNKGNQVKFTFDLSGVDYRQSL